MTHQIRLESTRRGMLVGATAAAVLPRVAKAATGPEPAAAAASTVVVDHYGAKGDGVTDDSRAIRAAVADLKAGGTLVFSSGRSYSSSNTIRIADRSDITVDAAGAAISTTARTDAAAVLLIENCIGVHVKGGNLHHSRAGVRRNAADGLTVNHCSHVLIEQVHVGRVYSIGIRASGSSDVVIRNCVVRNSLADGIGVYGGQRQAATPDGTMVAGSRTLFSRRSHFTPNDVGSTITVYGAGGFGRELVTTVTAYRSPSEVVIKAPALTAVSHQFVKIQRHSSRVTIMGNRLIDTGDDAISSVGYLTYARPNAHISVRNNRVSGSRARGILMTGTSHASIVDNDLRRIRMGGIFLVVEVGAVTTWGCTDILIDHNTVATVGTGYPRDNYPGIGAASTADARPIRDVRITDNTIRDAFSYYIDVGGYSATNTSASTRGVVVQGNRCLGGNRNNPAIQVIKARDVSVKQNYVQRARASAIAVTADVEGAVVVQDNVVSQYDLSGSGWAALDVEPTTARMIDNVVNGSSARAGLGNRPR